MEWLIEANRWFHMIIGFVGLAAWWVPILTKKGGKQHVFFGKVFALSAYIIGSTALAGVTMRVGYALWRGIDITENAAHLPRQTHGTTNQAVILDDVAIMKLVTDIPSKQRNFPMIILVQQTYGYIG